MSDLNDPITLKLQRRHARQQGLFAPAQVKAALLQAVKMLLPQRMAHSPVMFITEIGATLTTLITIQSVMQNAHEWWYHAVISGILWITVLFANLAEALAEARGKAQANTLRQSRQETLARRYRDGQEELIPSSQLRKGDKVKIGVGQMIPSDGEVIQGIASVDESAITGESAPVIREAGGDRSGVTGGTRVLSDEILMEITINVGESFMDRMIALVEGAQRQKTPNEIALTIVLAGITLGFLIVTVALFPMGLFFGVQLDTPTLIALLVCLIPTTIGSLLPAIGLAGMNRAMSANVLAKSGRAVELAGDIDTLLLDKTGTITLGNRYATRFLPVPNVEYAELVRCAVLASFGDTTPEGRSIVDLGQRELRNRMPTEPRVAKLFPFTAQTRLSGVDLPTGECLRKGAPNAIQDFITKAGGTWQPSTNTLIAEVAETGATPVVVSSGAQVLGVISLADVLKPGIQDRIVRLRAMGIRVVMVTGDNPITAEAIAREAGLDDFIAEARPEDKLDYIRREQASGRLVAMMGDGTNDAPALAQADIGVAMNSGTQAAKEASNMVDLDSDPTKLIEIVEIGKQLLMTRGALTTFSMANDVAKYFAIVPALFVTALPGLAQINLMGLATPQSAILAALIFNAIIIPLLIPIALKGVRYRPLGAEALLRHNLVAYGLGGIIVPFIGIKLIDLVLVGLHVV